MGKTNKKDEKLATKKVEKPKKGKEESKKQSKKQSYGTAEFSHKSERCPHT